MLRRFASGLLITGLVFLTACASPTKPENPQSGEEKSAARVDLSGTKSYLVTKSKELVTETAGLKDAAGAYYDLAKSHGFDYTTLWQKDGQRAREVIAEAKAHFLKANPAYELMEGIVAGVEQLAPFDVDLDAGIAASEGTDGVVSFDVTLPKAPCCSNRATFSSCRK